MYRHKAMFLFISIYLSLFLMDVEQQHGYFIFKYSYVNKTLIIVIINVSTWKNEILAYMEKWAMR